VTITAVRLIAASRMHDLAEQWITDRYRSVKADAAVVIIETDDGVTGIGEACPYGQPLQIADWVRWFEPQLVGADLDDHASVPRPTGSASAYDYAVAGIDCAWWDARAKLAGVPVRALLSPASSPAVPVYASSGVRYDWRRRPEDLIDDVLACAAAGYPLVKIRLGTAWAWDAVTPERFLALFDHVRAETGPGLALAVDANCRLNRTEALALARGLAERGAAWLEEPLPKEDLAGYAQLNAAVGIKISGGESWRTAEQFRAFLEAGCYDIVQPDAGVCGISEAARIGRLAESHGAELIPHSWHNGLMIMANAHLVASLPNSPMVEECMVQGPLKWDMVTGGTRVHGGCIGLDGPGLGVALTPDLAGRFPYVEGHYSVEVYR
jgi:L-alanine-DL-glutamate epimerase-like enolase superfamily enzyme